MRVCATRAKRLCQLTSSVAQPSVKSLRGSPRQVIHLAFSVHSGSMHTSKRTFGTYCSCSLFSMYTMNLKPLVETRTQPFGLLGPHVTLAPWSCGDALPCLTESFCKIEGEKINATTQGKQTNFRLGNFKAVHHKLRKARLFKWQRMLNECMPLSLLFLPGWSGLKLCCQG